jgi:glycosyltransferase involved in cell wall biosynthesis
MRIIFSTDSLSRGGKERQIAILASNLLKKNNELIFLAKRSDEINNFFKEYLFEKKITNTYKGFYNYYRIIKSFKPDIIVSWDNTSSVYNLLLSLFYNFSFINGSVRHGIRLFRFSHFYRSCICHLSPYVMANSKAGLKVNNLKQGRSRFVLYNGTEIKFKNDLAKSNIEILRKKLIPGYKDNPGFIYVSVANFVPYKDYFTVLKALSKLKLHFEFYYFIIGDGPMRGEIEKKIYENGIKKNVLLIGNIENVNEFLFISDIMIHSSRGEGISNAILEGMYAGLPIISTNVGGIPETIFPGSSLLFPFKDDQALFRCLLKSHELEASINPESEEYQSHLKKFSVGTMVSRFEEIVHTVLSEKK